MDTLLVSHPSCLEHEVPPGHPECPDRLRAVLGALEAEEFALLARVDAPRAEIGQLERVHARAHIDTILLNAPETGFRRLDGDTAVSPGSAEAALRAAGAVVYAVDEVMAARARNAFCAIRPPGHHAEPDQAMGFCLFNNVAVGAMHARHVYGLSRVAVVDFDVHHGNGTQALFETDPAFFYISTHQWPLYPGTGRASERGLDNIVNVTLPPGSDGIAFRTCVEGIVLPALERFQPEFIFISAGFDGHKDDPLANLRLTEADFGWVTEELVKLADRHAQGRIVSTLEGGYDLTALAASTRAHVRALMLG